MVAPLDANTLAKFANGLCRQLPDVRLARLGPRSAGRRGAGDEHLHVGAPAHAPAPAALAADAGAGHVPGHLDDVATVAQINARSQTFRIVGPAGQGALACGDVGDGAMADVADLVAAVADLLAGPPRVD